MRICLDTNAYSDWRKSGLWDNYISASKSEIFIPSIVVGELRTGFAIGRKGLENKKRLDAFLKLSEVNFVTVCEETTNLYAELALFLRKNGTPIPSNDIWIAAICIQQGALLLTRDRHFEKLPQVRVRYPE